MDELADHQKVHDLVKDIRFAMLSINDHGQIVSRPQAGEHDIVEL